jgi:hypothetical protein
MRWPLAAAHGKKMLYAETIAIWLSWSIPLVRAKIAYFTEAGFIDVTENPFVKGRLTRITGTRPSP